MVETFIMLHHKSFLHDFDQLPVIIMMSVFISEKFDRHVFSRLVDERQQLGYRRDIWQSTGSYKIIQITIIKHG